MECFYHSHTGAFIFMFSGIMRVAVFDCLIVPAILGGKKGMLVFYVIHIERANIWMAKNKET